jgi:polyhydroxybutyrate depolymerase
MGQLPVGMRIVTLAIIGLLSCAATKPDLANRAPADTAAAKNSSAPNFKFLSYLHQRVGRLALMHRPASLGAKPAPVIVALHGLGQSIDSLRDWLRLDDVAERAGFTVVYPQAINLSWSYGTPLARPMPAVNGETVDDIGFIRTMIDDLVARKLADPARIYVTGMSRGGLMTFTLACALADRIAAAAPLITGMTDHQRDECHPARALPMMAVAGTADRSEPYDGDVAPNGHLLSMPETMEYWRKIDGCHDEVARALPHLHDIDPTEINLVEWRNCSSDTALKLYRVQRGGHQLPSFVESTKDIDTHFGLRNHDMDTAEAVWNFVSRYSNHVTTH